MCCAMIANPIFMFHVPSNKKSPTDFAQSIYVFAIVVIVVMEAIDANDQCRKIFSNQSVGKHPMWFLETEDRFKYIIKQINAQPWVPAPSEKWWIPLGKNEIVHALLIGLDWSRVNSMNSFTLKHFWAACHYNWQRRDINFLNTPSAFL